LAAAVKEGWAVGVIGNPEAGGGSFTDSAPPSTVCIVAGTLKVIDSTIDEPSTLSSNVHSVTVIHGPMTKLL
jgi:hypothetical protein